MRSEAEGRTSMPAVGTWRSVPALAAPIEVSASEAAPGVSGDMVRAAAFVSATTGWAVVKADNPTELCLLRTEDAGITWTSQLAWAGELFDRLRVFDAQRASLMLGLWPTHRNEVNGRAVAIGQPFYNLVAGTQDRGATWTLGSPPDLQGKSVYFLTPQQIWMLIQAPGPGGKSNLAHTDDGGATWSQMDGCDDLPPVGVAFSSPTDGLLIAANLRRADILYRTNDSGITWTRQELAPPEGMPKRAETWLFPVLTPEVGGLLTLRAVSRQQSATRPMWEGAYAYARDGDSWSGPHRLPMAPASSGNELLVPGPDGRLWGASGHDVWISDHLTGPWQHLRVPLPDEERIEEVYPMGDGVLWLTSSRGMAGGGLYRSEDDGGHWTRLPVN